MAVIINVGDVRAKFTLVLRGHGQSLSESWYTKSGAPVDDIATAVTYATIRQRMISPALEIASLRLGVTNLNASQYTDGKDPLRQSRAFYPGPVRWLGANSGVDLPGAGTYVPPAGQQQELTFANDCLRVSLLYDNTRFVERYIAWVPKGTVAENGAFRPGSVDAGWMKAYGDLVGLITGDPASGFGTVGPLFIKAQRASSNTNTFPIDKWGLSAEFPSNVWFETRGGAAAALKPGDRVHIRHSKLVPDMSFGGAAKLQQMNGTWIVADVTQDTPAVGSTHVVLQFTRGIPADRMKIPGTFQLVEYKLFPVLDVAPVQVSTHKRGASAGAPRGRRLTRIRLDP